MKTEAALPTLLKDYQAPPYWIDQVGLQFDLGESGTIVTSRIGFERNPKQTDFTGSLVLDGEVLELLSVAIDGRVLTTEDYRVDQKSLTLLNPPEKFSLECVTRIYPEKNTTLEGLYKSSGNFCTQCEAQGFRRITYYLDRPDVMAIFTVTIRGEKSKYPYLLSNGNPISAKDLPNGLHEATWNDPFRKPSYLFALVAGDLERVEDHFITKSGRDVKLEIFVNHGKKDRTAHAMESLKRAMKWDEERFGLEYDLDIFMIVAVDDFNFGAMENKGLNIFNSRLVLADPSSATDADYMSIEAVVGHEYFHNWSGDRVTCRDWFQLSLKEGLTVYRDQEFTADMTSRGVKRIADVAMLRSRQFPEDAGPMAHPIRPESYIEINNFYTATVYEKGSEVIRMIATLLGREKFARGISTYFELFDGQAVTCEDFVQSMEKGSGIDLKQFRHWYSQAGTPTLQVTSDYSAQTRTYTLTVKQSCAPSPGQPEKKPYHMPLAMALLDSNGHEVVSEILEVSKPEQKFVFEGVMEKPTPSLLRDFSAPVYLDYPYTESELLFLLARDGNGFARWEAGQKLSQSMIQQQLAGLLSGKSAEVSQAYLESFGAVLGDSRTDEGTRAEILSLPAQDYIEQLETRPLHPDLIWKAISQVKEALSTTHQAAFLRAYQERSGNEAYRYDAASMGKRALKNTALSFLCQGGRNAELALAQLKAAAHHTDEVVALRLLSEMDGQVREEAMDYFYRKWKGDSLVMNKWLTAQATSSARDGLERVEKVLRDPVFQIGNPNHVRSVLNAFTARNPLHFHRIDGQGYRFIADQIIDLDARNPSVSAKLASCFNSWKRYEPKRRVLMQAELDRLASKKLSPGTYEIVMKALI